MTTDSPPRWRRGAGMLTAVAVGASLVALPTAAASAAEGPAPTPHERTVLGNVHTDAISTFYENGELVLASKADVPERATKYDEESLWFHVSNAAAMTLPASGFEFIAPGGSDVWLAPMTQDPAVIWPGFSTESVPAGTFDGDTTFTLLDVEGPGEVELFLNGSFGGVGERLWSSDETSAGSDTDLKSFSRPSSGIHMHANWAFTAPGLYDFTVRADATKGGAPLSATATYTFVVGELPEDADTTTTLATSTAETTLGEEVTLDATVTPAVGGYVEFLDGTTVLGHDEVVDGAASFATSALGLGERSLTARYVPAVENLSNTSTSAAVTVTVAEEGQEEVFGVYGLRESYAAGETIDLRVGGATLEGGQQWRWLLREGEGQTEYTSAALTGTDRITRDATVGFDGVQVAVKIIEGRTTVQQTAWYTIRVEGPNVGIGEAIDVAGIADSYYRGDPVQANVGHRPLADGETVRWVSRPLTYGLVWEPTSEWNAPLGENPYLIDPSYLGFSEYAYEIIAADGTLVGRSAAISPEIKDRELQVSGIQSVYRVGDSVEAASDLFPARDGVRYQWYLQLDGGWEPIEGETAPTISLPVTADMDQAYLSLEVNDEASGFLVGFFTQTLRVTDAAPGEQLVLLDSLSGHYHQGGTVRLNAKADPVASDSDTWRWLWKRPDQAEFVEIDGATGPSHEVRAQQALDGTLVKAELLSAAGEVLAASDTVTILVDDHGAAPQEKAAIHGLAEEYRAGDEVALTASVSPSSVLTRWEWYVQKEGDAAPMLVEGRHDDGLSFAAAPEYDNAAIFARLTFEDGRAYVESAPVLLNVAESDGGPVETTITIEGLADRYNVGDTMTLSANQDPHTGEDHWHWFIKTAGTEEYSVIAGQATSTLTRLVAAGDDGASIIARLYDDDHAVIAESEPVVVTVDDNGSGGQPQNPQKPVDAAQPRTGDELGESTQRSFGLTSTTFTQGQVITLELGEDFPGAWTAAWLFSTPTLLGGDWTQANSQGAIAVRVPVDAAIGEHRLAVFAADGSVIGWTTISIVASDGTVPTGTLPATGGSIGPLWIAFAVLLVGTGAAALVIGRRRRTRAGS